MNSTARPGCLHGDFNRASTVASFFWQKIPRDVNYDLEVTNKNWWAWNLKILRVVCKNTFMIGSIRSLNSNDRILSAKVLFFKSRLARSNTLHDNNLYLQWSYTLSLKTFAQKICNWHSKNKTRLLNWTMVILNRGWIE